MTKLRADKCQTTTQESTTSRRAEKFLVPGIQYCVPGNMLKSRDISTKHNKAQYFSKTRQSAYMNP